MNSRLAFRANSGHPDSMAMTETVPVGPDHDVPAVSTSVTVSSPVSISVLGRMTVALAAFTVAAIGCGRAHESAAGSRPVGLASDMAGPGLADPATAETAPYVPIWASEPLLRPVPSPLELDGLRPWAANAAANAAGQGRGDNAGYTVAARLFAFADSQLHYVAGKRTFAQSPFADIMSLELAVRPAALDDGSDLLLRTFLEQRRRFYPDHMPIFLGDATDLSCTHEMDAFVAVLGEAGLGPLLAVTSNHDGFYVGNFTSKRDLGGTLSLTDMPHDWTRACAIPGRFADYRLTKGKAVSRLRALLPPGPAWATSFADDGPGPSDFRRAHLYYARPLGGGDPGAPPVWGLFMDTVDYRGFDLEASMGAGSVGAVSSEQIRFLDRAALEAQARAGPRPVHFVLFGHHPFDHLEPASRARVRHFMAGQEHLIAYVSAHEHDSDERYIDLGPRSPGPAGATGAAKTAARRTLLELIVASTTDAPHAARAIEIHVATNAEGSRRGRADDARLQPAHRAGADGRAVVYTRRLVLDAERLCPRLEPLRGDALGYTGYRMIRSGIPEFDLDLLEVIQLALSLDDLAAKRTLQGLGALLMENNLMRAWAHLYANSPIEFSPEEQTALGRIRTRPYAQGRDLAQVWPFLRPSQPPSRRRPQRPKGQDAGQDAGQAADQDAGQDASQAYVRWHDPAIAPLLARAEVGMHRFGTHVDMVGQLRARRRQSRDSQRFFLCHAMYAARAEAAALRRRGDILYVR